MAASVSLLATCANISSKRLRSCGAESVFAVVGVVAGPANVCASAAKARAFASFRSRLSTRLRRLQALVGPPLPARNFIQRLGSDVRPVGPHHGPTINEKALEVLWVLER